MIKTYFLLLFSLLIQLSSLNGELSMQTPKKTRIIINPHSGTEEKSNLEKLIKEHLNSHDFPYEIVYTSGPKDATRLSKEAAQNGYDLVIAVGGDGTVNEVSKGLIGSDTALGIIPAGSGNGFARHLKIPTEPLKAIENIQNFNLEAIDTVRINDEYFLGVAGIGFDAHIAWKFAESKQRGLASYALLVFKEYPFYSSRTFDFLVDGEPLQRTALIVSFAKSSQYGNNFYIAPQAKANDGLIYLIFLKQPPFYAIPSLITQAKKGTIDKSSYYESIPCKKIEILGRPLYAHLDGEPVYFPQGLVIEILPKTLKAIVGQ